MNKKRLAFIIPSLKAGGAERVVSTLANELIKDFDVLIIVLYKCDPFYKLDNAIRVEFCKTYYNKNLSTFQSIQNHYKLILKILKFVKHYKPNLLIGFMTTANVYAIIVSKIKKVPSIIS